MSESFKDGLIVKVGLVLIALGYIGAISQIYQGDNNFLRPLHSIGMGIMLCIIGVLIRGSVHSEKKRRISDWLDHSVTK